MSVRLISCAGLIAAASTLASSAMADDKDGAVTVRIFTPLIVEKDGSKVKEVSRALEGLPSVKIIPHSEATPHLLVEFSPQKAELGELARAIASVEPAMKEKPAAYLMLTALLDKEEQAALLKGLASVKGVDVKRSEFPGGLPRIALDNAGGARFSEVAAAVKAAAPRK